MFCEGMGISFNVKLFLRYYHWRDQVQIIVTIIVAIIRPRINLYTDATGMMICKNYVAKTFDSDSGRYVPIYY